MITSRLSADQVPKNHPPEMANGADFVYSEYGFSKLISFKNGDLAVEFWVLSDESPAGKRVFSKRISDRGV